MKSITRLFGAVASLAASLESLAALVNTTTARLQQSLAVEVIEPPALPAPDQDSDPEPPARRRARVAS